MGLIHLEKAIKFLNKAISHIEKLKPILQKNVKPRKKRTKKK